MSLYGNCPICGAEGRQRERRPDGNDVCQKGHIYPSSKAVVAVSMTALALAYLQSNLDEEMVEVFNAHFEKDYNIDQWEKIIEENLKKEK